MPKIDPADFSEDSIETFERRKPKNQNQTLVPCPVCKKNKMTKGERDSGFLCDECEEIAEKELAQT